MLRAEKPVLVDFWAPWCTYCRRIAPAVDQVAGQYGEQMVVGKVNVDEQPELAERFGVETIPLLVFRNGQAGEPLIAPLKGADCRVGRTVREEVRRMGVKHYDVIVIGGGPGGYTAALYCARSGRSVAVLEKLSAGMDGDHGPD